MNEKKQQRRERERERDNFLTHTLSLSRACFIPFLFFSLL